MTVTSQSANLTWKKALFHVMTQGVEAGPRGKKTKELLGFTTRFNMNYPVISIPERKISEQFMANEALWITSGDDRLETIIKHAPQYARFSDDGETLYGAYGPRLANQLWSACETLVKDIESRQAVINYWRENPKESKDIPCTTSSQFIVRDGLLHCIDNMRSSDLWLGWPYDVFTFTVISHLVMWNVNNRFIEAGKKPKIRGLGELTLNAGSSHLYETNWAKVRTVLGSSEPFDTLDRFPTFDSGSELLRHLGNVTKGICNMKGEWLSHE